MEIDANLIGSIFPFMPTMRMGYNTTTTKDAIETTIIYGDPVPDNFYKRAIIESHRLSFGIAWETSALLYSLYYGEFGGHKGFIDRLMDAHASGKDEILIRLPKDSANFANVVKGKSFVISSPRWECIYFVKNRENDTVKIGYSKNPLSRVISLQTATPDKLQLLGIICGDRKTEKVIHKMFKTDHIRREWFYLSDKLLSFFDHPQFVKINTIKQKCPECKKIKSIFNPTWSLCCLLNYKFFWPVEVSIENDNRCGIWYNGEAVLEELHKHYRFKAGKLWK